MEADIEAVTGRYRQAADSAERLMKVWVGPMDSLKRPEPATAWLPSCAAAPAPVKEDGHIVPEVQPEVVARLIENLYAGVIVLHSPPQGGNDCPLPKGERAE